MPASPQSVEKWYALSRAGKSWAEVSKDNARQLKLYGEHLRTTDPRFIGKNLTAIGEDATPAGQAYQSELAKFNAELPHKPPSGGFLKTLVPAIIKGAATGIVLGGITDAATKIGKQVGNDLLGNDTMGFFDDIKGSFDQVSSLVKQGEDLYSHVQNFGNAGGTSQPAPGTLTTVNTYGPPSHAPGIPSWVWIVAGIGAAILIFRK